MINILRISAYPTKTKPGMGLNSYMISGMDNVVTHYFSPDYGGEELSIKKNTIKFKFYHYTRPIRKHSYILGTYDLIMRCIGLLKLLIQVVDYLRKNNIDIVHIHSPMYILIALYCKIIKTPCLITFHGKEYVHIFNNYFLAKVFRKVILEIFSLSPDILKTKYINMFRNKINIIKNGVDTKTFYNQKLKRNNKFLAVGRLEFQKGYDTLLRAFKQVHVQNPDASLTIVGSGNLYKQLLKLTDDLDLNEYVTYINAMKVEELFRLYNTSSVFVLSSRWEGFPKVILEAIACGCKVVSTKIDAVPTILNDSFAYLVDVDNIDDLSKSMSAALNEVNEDHEIISQKIISKYDWKSIRDDMESHYLRIYEQNFNNKLL